MTKSNFSEKKKSFGKKSKISSKIGFLVFDENLIYWPVFCTLKWHGAMLFMILQKQYYWGKSGSLFPSAQNALNQSDCRSLWSTTSHGGVNRYLRFLHGHKGKVESGTTFFGAVWPVAPFIQVNCMIIWSSISLEGIIFIIVFLYGVIHQGKLALWTNTFWWDLTLIFDIKWKNKAKLDKTRIWPLFYRY